MPGLNHVEKNTNNRLKKHLTESGYEPMCHTPELWKHASHDIVFTFVVDDFRANYKNRQDVKHLINSLQILYPVITYGTG